MDGPAKVLNFSIIFNLKYISKKIKVEIDKKLYFGLKIIGNLLTLNVYKSIYFYFNFF